MTLMGQAANCTDDRRCQVVTGRNDATRSMVQNAATPPIP